VTLLPMSQPRTSLHQTTIEIPTIIGKWMPLEKLEEQGETLNSTYILKNALRMEEFLQTIYQWIKRPTLLPEKIHLLSSNSDSLSSDKLENVVYLRNNRSIKNDIDE